MTRPRIGLDLHVVDGIYQGSRTHCLELFSRVVAITPECDFFAMAAEPQKLVSFSANFSLPNVSLVSVPKTTPFKRLLWQLPRIARKFRFDLLHSQYITPLFLPCATAVTIHDVLFESHPEYFGRFFVMRSRFLVRRSARRSAEVFTVSEFSRRQICRNCTIGDDKVHTIPNGVDTARFYAGQDGSEAVEALGLTPGDFFLTVGRLEPRKNQANLLRAWAALDLPRPRLVIVGQRDFGYDEVFGLIKSLHLTNDVIVIESVSDQQLPALYRNAKAFVYPSWTEGFGMPVLEAMASGIPVIASSGGALPEICGGAALLVRPESVEEISEAIRILDQQVIRRKELVELGTGQIAKFNWDNSATIVRRSYLLYFGLQ